MKLDPKLVEVRCVKIVGKRLKIIVLVSFGRRGFPLAVFLKHTSRHLSCRPQVCTQKGDKTTDYGDKFKSCAEVMKHPRLRSTFKAGFDDGYNKDRLGLFVVKEFLIKNTRGHKHVSKVSHGKCGCIFHKFCIERWIAEYNTACPNCKKPWEEVLVEKTT